MNQCEKHFGNEKKLDKTLLVQNDDWQLSQEDAGYLVESRDGQFSLGPMPAQKIANLLAIVEYLDNLLKSQ